MSNFDLRKYLAESKLVTEDKIDMINKYAQRIATGEEIQDEFFMDNKEEILQAADEIEKYMNSDIDIEESNIEEGWKEWALGGLMSLATLAGVGQAYLPNLDSLSSQEEIELTQNAYADALRKMSEEDVDSVYRQVVQSDIEGDLQQNEFTFTDRTTKATADAAWPAMQQALLRTAIARNMDRFVISKDGNVVFISNPGGITAIKENKPSMKMKKSELKEMIKAAFIAENYMDDDAALQGMYGGDNLYEEEEESLDDILSRISGTSVDPYMAEAEEKEETAEEILARITGTKVDPYMAEAQVDMPKINLPAINAKIENNPKIDVIAAKIQNDPKAMDALNKLASMYGLNKMNELDSSDFRSIEMAAKKFASNLQEMEDSDDVSLTVSGFLGGPLLFMTIPGLYEFVLQLIQSMQANPEYVVGTDSLIMLGSVVAGVTIGNILDRIKNANESVTEAKDEEEEMDITVDAEEETTDDGEGKLANDSIVVDKKIVSLSSLPQQTRKILDSLETLRAQAEEFGDQKFITQVGNTITFFTRDFVVAGDEPTKAKVDESLEILRMKKLAGLLTEGEYAKALLKEYEEPAYDNASPYPPDYVQAQYDYEMQKAREKATYDPKTTSDALLLKKYHDILMKVGGQDLAGDFKDIFNKAKTFKSTLDFIKNDLSILAQDDKDQVNDIKQALNQYSEINL